MKKTTKLSNGLSMGSRKSEKTICKSFASLKRASALIGGGYSYRNDSITKRFVEGNQMVLSKNLKIQANNKRFSDEEYAELYKNDKEEFYNLFISGNEKRVDSIARKGGINPSSSESFVLSWKCLDKTIEFFDKFVPVSTPVLPDISDSIEFIRNALIDDTDKAERANTIGKIIDGSTINAYIHACHGIVASADDNDMIDVEIKEAAEFYDQKRIKVTFIDKKIYHGSQTTQGLQAMQVISYIYVKNSTTWGKKAGNKFEYHFERCVTNFMYAYKRKIHADLSVRNFLNGVNAVMFLMMPQDIALKDYSVDDKKFFSYKFFANIFEDNAKKIIQREDKQMFIFYGDKIVRKDSEFVLTENAFKLEIVQSLFESTMTEFIDGRSDLFAKTINAINSIYKFALGVKNKTKTIGESGRDRLRYPDALMKHVDNVDTNQAIFDVTNGKLESIQRKIKDIDIYSNKEIDNDLDDFLEYIINTIKENHLHEKYIANTKNYIAQLDACILRTKSEGMSNEEIVKHVAEYLEKHDKKSLSK